MYTSRFLLFLPSCIYSHSLRKFGNIAKCESQFKFFSILVRITSEIAQEGKPLDIVH